LRVRGISRDSHIVDSLLVEQRIGTLMAEIKAKYEEQGRKQLEEMIKQLEEIMKQMMTFLSNHFPSLYGSSWDFPPHPPPSLTLYAASFYYIKTFVIYF